MNRVSIFAASNLDPTGITWTDLCPSKVVAARFTSLAKAACGMLKDQGTALEPKVLFVASLADYDFVIHLNPRPTKDNGREKRHSAFKNLNVLSEQDSVENIAYRMSASWHMRILVPSRSLQGDGNLYHK